jgi:hypothetical protein
VQSGEKTDLKLGKGLDDGVVDTEQGKMHFKVESPWMNQDGEVS